jgi:putative ABC transport system permease protein
MTGFLHDLRYGWRSLTRSPGFAAVIIGTLALGVGANSMIFSVVNTMALKPLPHLREQGLVNVMMVDRKQGEDELESSFPNFMDIRARATSFEAAAASYESHAYITLDREPERFHSAVITPGMFRVLGVRPALGREFLPHEEQDGNQWSSVIVGHRIWTERLGADPNVLGRTLKMNGRVRTIVGIAPEHMRYPEIADFYIPAGYKPAEDLRDQNYYNVVARLRPGVTIQQANAEVAGIGAELARSYPDTNKDFGFRVVGFRQPFVKEMTPMLTMLMSAVIFVLLIACANIANLMLARGAGRTREIGLRFALGASRGRIVRQLLTEGLLVALVGGALGILLAQLGMDLVLSSIPQELPFWMEFGLDGRVLAFTLGVSVLAAILFALAPALQVSSVDPHEALKEGGAHGGSRRGNRMRSALVVAEVSLALVLLTGGGLMIRSFLRQQAESSRLDMRGVLTANVTLPIAVYKDEEARRVFFDALFPALEALPGVQSVSAVQTLPLSRSSWRTLVVREGVAQDREGTAPLYYYGITRPAYFRTMGIPVRKGRDFSAQDGASATPVAIVNQTAARKLWPDQDPIGRRFKFGRSDTARWTAVVGVVADVRQHIEDSKPNAQVFVPHAQNTVQTLALVIRGQGDPGTLAAAVRRVVQSRDADLPLYDVRTMRQAAQQALWEPRIYVWLMGVFAGIALLIAAVGIYGVMAYNVSQRTQEIGIRMALGAAQQDVVRMVVGQALRLTALGVGIGLAAAYAMTRLMASLLFGVSANDPPTFAGVAVILALSGVVAAWVPTVRATRVDPMVALRSE